MDTVITLHDQESTKDYKKEFSRFLSLYNVLNNTEISLSQGLKSDELQVLFERTKNVTQKSHEIFVQKPTFKHKGSTKVKSYDLLDIPKIDEEVLEYVKANPKKSRADISDSLSIRLQTVCGACNRLISNGYIFVSGQKIDPLTRRHVEVLESK